MHEVINGCYFQWCFVIQQKTSMTGKHWCTGLKITPTETTGTDELSHGKYIWKSLEGCLQSVFFKNDTNSTWFKVYSGIKHKRNTEITRQQAFMSTYPVIYKFPQGTLTCVYSAFWVYYFTNLNNSVSIYPNTKTYFIIEEKNINNWITSKSLFAISERLDFNLVVLKLNFL